MNKKLKDKLTEVLAWTAITIMTLATVIFFLLIYETIEWYFREYRGLPSL